MLLLLRWPLDWQWDPLLGSPKREFVHKPPVEVFYTFLNTFNKSLSYVNFTCNTCLASKCASFSVLHFFLIYQAPLIFSSWHSSQSEWHQTCMNNASTFTLPYCPGSEPWNTFQWKPNVLHCKSPSFLGRAVDLLATVWADLEEHSLRGLHRRFGALEPLEPSPSHPLCAAWEKRQLSVSPGTKCTIPQANYSAFSPPLKNYPWKLFACCHFR